MLQVTDSDSLRQLVGKKVSTMTSKFTKLFTRNKRSEKISDSGDNGAGAASMSIGEPFNVVRNYHVNFDKNRGEFVGLPPSWRDLLDHSDIS